jgi:hypothetical protein
MRAYLESRTTYVAGARSLGFEVNALPEEQVNNLAYGVLQFLRLPNLAVWLFQENVRDYPKSANAYDSLGDGLLAAGDTASAIEQFSQSISVARQGGQSDTTATKKKLAPLMRDKVKP